MRDLVAQGYADRKKVEEELVPAMAFNYSTNQTPIPLPIVEGRFA